LTDHREGRIVPALGEHDWEDPMLLRLLVVASIAVAGQASGQIIKTPFAMQREYVNFHLGNPKITHDAADCLVHKKSGRVICKSRTEWRAIAARLDTLQRPASAPK
jgi:hypothetical protein